MQTIHKTYCYVILHHNSLHDVLEACDPLVEDDWLDWSRHII